jgi:hypothetical protein
MDLIHKIVKPSDIDAETRLEMFNIMDLHYANTFPENFTADLEKKTHVIMLYDPESNRLCGFSTQKIFPFKLNGEEILVLFSGDTIIRKEYWGSLQLSIAFGKLMIETIRLNPAQNFYWMLISKGVRTYKFLHAFFIEYFPKFGTEISPEIKIMMDALAYSMYPEQYDKASMVIRALPDGQYLRPEFQQFEVSGNRELDTFFKLNPGFSHGDELVCFTHLTIENLRPFIKRALQRAFPSEMNFGT